MAGTRGGVTVTDLRRLQSALQRMNDAERRAWNEDAVKELAARLLAKVIRRTPVGVYPASSGKNGGTLRRGWTVGEVEKAGDVYTIELRNPVEYAPYVEFGHRTPDHSGWVEGQFMLTVSEQELQRDAPRILLNKLNRFMGGAFR